MLFSCLINLNSGQGHMHIGQNGKPCSTPSGSMVTLVVTQADFWNFGPSSTMQRQQAASSTFAWSQAPVGFMIP